MNYRQLKEKARNEAIDWQSTFTDSNYSYSEIAYWQGYFTKLATIYGLVKEFKENGII